MVKRQIHPVWSGSVRASGMVGVSAFLGALVALGGCSKSSGAATIESPSGKRTNVLLLTLCTMRADHLGCYGYERPTSPHIDAMAAEGVRFEYNLTQAPWTRASMAAMVTGLFPRTLNIAEPDRRDEPRLLHESFTTLAERMQHAGYFTIGVTANAMLNTEFGFRQGYDFWHDTGSGWKRAKRDGLLRMEDLNDLLFEGIAQADGKRFFAHLVNVDVHDPRKEAYPLESPEPFGNAAARSATDRYDLRIRYLDEQFGKLRKRLVDAGLGDTLIVINGDHGEGLGGFHSDDHGHGGRLYNSTLWVPWILYHPGLKPARSVIPDLAQNIDLVPTVLDLLGIAYEPAEVAGVSRVTNFNGSGTPATIPFSVVETEFKHSHKSAIVTDTWKLIVDRNPCVDYQQVLDPPLYELYRYREDRIERDDVFSSQADVARDLERRLVEWQKATLPQITDAQAMATEIRQETENELKLVLGYIGSEDDDDEVGSEASSTSQARGCWASRSASPPDSTPARGDGPATVVLITVNGLRASHLGSYGYFRPTTPTLDQLAAQSVVWDRCLASNLTSPTAHRALLTGSLTTGVPGQAPDRQAGVPVDGSMTLAEFARQSGMKTAAFTSIPAYAAPKEPLLALGFERYDAPKKKRRPADKVTNRALNWLKNVSREPVLLWVNYSDLQRANPVAPCMSRILTSDAAFESWVDQRWASAEASMVPADRLKLAAAYDQNLRFIDLQIGELLEGLCGMGRLDNAVIVVVGDQGRIGTGEGNRASIPSWDDARVPLMIRGTGNFALSPRRVSDWATTVDMAATVVGRINGSLAGIDSVGRDGADLLGTRGGRVSALSQGCEPAGSASADSTSCSAVLGYEDWLWIRASDGKERLHRLEGNEAPAADVKEQNPELLRKIHELWKSNTVMESVPSRSGE